MCSTGAQAGLVEFLEGAESVDRIKKALPRGLGLKSYFELTFGESYSFFYAKAVQNFVRSLVGYSLLTYLVQVRCSCCVVVVFCMYRCIDVAIVCSLLGYVLAVVALCCAVRCCVLLYAPGACISSTLLSRSFSMFSKLVIVLMLCCYTGEGPAQREHPV